MAQAQQRALARVMAHVVLAVVSQSSLLLAPTVCPMRGQHGLRGARAHHHVVLALNRGFAM